MTEEKETITNKVHKEVKLHHKISFWMVAAIGVFLMRTQCDVRDIYHRTRAIEERLNNPGYELTTKDVIRGKAPEKFYEIGGKRVYLEVDGKPVEDYLGGGN